MDSEALRRADEATFVEEVIEPLAWAAIHDRAFCRSMGDESRAVATLWTLAVQVFRNGLFYFVEDEPAWVVRSVASAARTFGDERLAAMAAALEPELRRGRGGRLRAPKPAVMEERGAPLEAYVAGRAEVGPLDRRVHAWARERLDVLWPDVQRAREMKARQEQERADAAREAERARRDAWEQVRTIARPWSMRERFEPGEVMLHPKLGLGRVLRLVASDKIEVTFEDGSTRTLAHGRA